MLSLASHVPGPGISNLELACSVETNDEWISTRTGIRSRHKLDDNENASDLAYQAAIKALDNAGCSAGDLTHIVAATCSPDHLSPSVACILAGRLGAGAVMAFDVNAACSGFIYGLSTCHALLAARPGAKILFVCAEALTRRINWQDRTTCVLFGDAATACIIADSGEDPLASLVDCTCLSDGSQHGLITVGGGTSCRYAHGSQIGDEFFISMNGRETYKHAVRQMTRICREILDKNGLGVDDVALFVPHQANLRIIEAVGDRLGMDSSRVFTNVHKYGNTSAASIPLALDEAINEGRAGKGEMVLVTAFGAGLTFGAGLLRF